MHLQRTASQFWLAFQELLFPQANSCHVCERGLNENGILCSDCMDELLHQRFPADKMILKQHKTLQASVAVFPHEGISRRLIHLLKYENDASVVPLLSEFMGQALLQTRETLLPIDVVIPVPLHPSREENRGFNQAALLAREVCFQSRLELLENVLIRSKATTPQIRRNREERLKAMHDVFEVQHKEWIQHGNVLLVDDVLTTGATAMACAHTLLNAGAQSVALLTVCRAEKKKSGSD